MPALQWGRYSRFGTQQTCHEEGMHRALSGQYVVAACMHACMHDTWDEDGGVGAGVDVRNGGSILQQGQVRRCTACTPGV